MKDGNGMEKKINYVLFPCFDENPNLDFDETKSRGFRGSKNSGTLYFGEFPRFGR